jgi:hypothetical protein
MLVLDDVKNSVADPRREKHLVNLVNDTISDIIVGVDNLGCGMVVANAFHFDVRLLVTVVGSTDSTPMTTWDSFSSMTLKAKESVGTLMLGVAVTFAYSQGERVAWMAVVTFGGKVAGSLNSTIVAIGYPSTLAAGYSFVSMAEKAMKTSLAVVVVVTVTLAMSQRKS